MDYKSMISDRRREAINLRENRGQYTLATEFEEDADAIKTLLAERDAAIADIFQSSDSLCNVCKYFPDDFSPICFNCTQIGGLNNNWQWRGPQKHD